MIGTNVDTAAEHKHFRISEGYAANYKGAEARLTLDKVIKQGRRQ